MKYIRSTHNVIGHPKKFSDEANAVWQEHGFIGHMLGSKPMTIIEIMDAIQQHRIENDENIPISKEELILALDKLAEFGLIQKVD